MGGVVVLACYEGAAHLRAQLDSIAAQSLRPDLVIISDDGSRNDSLGVSLAPCRPLGFRHALVQNFAGGNTMMVNRAGIDLLQAAVGDPRRAGVVPVVHDW